MATPINVTANVKTTAIKAVVRVVGPKGDKGEQGDPATNLVTSVNGKQDAVVLDHTDVGADVAGAAVEALVDAQAYTDDAIDALTKADIGLSDVPNLDTTAAVANEHTHANKTVLDSTTASFTTAEKSKLSGIEPGATQNASDADLRDRATHTGTQAISTVAGLQDALEAIPDTLIPMISDVATELSAHEANTSNPHAVTKAQVGLGSVDNTSDANKPVSSATQTALNGKLSLTGGTITGPVITSQSTLSYAHTRAAETWQWGATANGTFGTWNNADSSYKFEVSRTRTTLNGIQHIPGSGSPNGVVSAPVGSRYIDTAATGGFIEWIKSVGTGNTGWTTSPTGSGIPNITASVTEPTAPNIGDIWIVL